jgi:hypothetical protein
MVLFIRRSTYIGALRTRNHYILYSSLLLVYIIKSGPLCLVGKFQFKFSTLILELCTFTFSVQQAVFTKSKFDELFHQSPPIPSTYSLRKE